MARKIKTKIKQVCTGYQLQQWRNKQRMSRATLAVLIDQCYETICRAEQRRSEPIPDGLLKQLLYLTLDPQTDQHIVPARVSFDPLTITKPIPTTEMEVPA